MKSKFLICWINWLVSISFGNTFIFKRTFFFYLSSFLLFICPICPSFIFFLSFNWCLSLLTLYFIYCFLKSTLFFLDFFLHSFWQIPWAVLWLISLSASVKIMFINYGKRLINKSYLFSLDGIFLWMFHINQDHSSEPMKKKEKKTCCFFFFLKKNENYAKKVCMNFVFINVTNLHSLDFLLFIQFMDSLSSACCVSLILLYE